MATNKQKRADFITYPDGVTEQNYYFPSTDLDTTAQSPNLSGLFAKGKQFINNNWSSSKGLNLKNVPLLGNVNIGKVAPWVQGGVSAVQALGGISDYTQNTSDYQDMLGDVLREYNSNPLANYYLTNAQKSDIRKMQRGNYSGGEADFSDFLKGAGSGLSGAIAPTLIGLATGGVPGAIVGGVGSLINSGISGMNSAVAQDTADLEALYQTLVDANAQYNSMKKIPMAGLGLQQKYVNQYQ